MHYDIAMYVPSYENIRLAIVICLYVKTGALA